MYVRKPSGDLELLHTEAPALAGSASTTTVGRNVVSGGRARRSPGMTAGYRGISLRVVAGVAVAVLAVGVIGRIALRGGAAQASVTPGNAVTAFGGAPNLASSVTPAEPFVAIASTPSGHGYWVASSDGGVFAYGDAHFYGSAGSTHLNQPIVGIAATPTGNGYWLVGRDGGVFAFGDAGFFGSAGATPLNQPIVGIAASGQGDGYWLVASDGGVFSFGGAPFLGSVTGLGIGTDVVGVAATPSREGYWLVASDGGVFTFGDAVFAGSEAPIGISDASGIAASGSSGYWIVRRNGTILGFHTGADTMGLTAVDPSGTVTNGIAARAGGGYWTVQGQAPDLVDHMNPFLVCTRAHESSHVPPAYDTGYAAVNPTGTYRGAYQFDRSTWNNAAMRAGRLDLVGVDPATASVADQDLLALDLYHWQGAGPWLGRCAGK